ncbi:Aldo/keto reductase [Peniophora sp. CONT]|nr:Aldo/keto reductase [Peniophora sp. CONT]
MTEVPHATLNTGAKIPLVGLGCWMGMPGGEQRVYDMCIKAIAAGYRHIDTAAGYANEEYVGKAIRDSGIPRSEFFVTTKLPNTHHAKVEEALDASLTALGLDYVDLYLMHWPQATATEDWFGPHLPPGEFPTFNDTWAGLEKVYEKGKARAIGISNFSVKTLEPLLKTAKVVPAVNQIQMHPFLPQNETKALCDAKGIHLTAYSPIGQPGESYKGPSLLGNDLIVQLAEKYSATPAQIVLSWGVQRGTSVIPKSENEDRLRNNITVVKLDAADVKAVDELHTQPGLHRSLLVAPGGVKGQVFGWTYDQLGWNMDDNGVVKA